MSNNKLIKESSRYVIGVYDHENAIMNAVQKVQEEGLKVHEVFSPHPIHHLDVYIGHPRTRIPIAAFCFATLGFSLAILMITFMLGIDWPMIIGGKNYVSIPTMVPVTFEATVLIAALGMVTTFFISNNMGPGKEEFSFDRRSTDDKYVLVVDMDKNEGKSQEEISQILLKYGAEASPKMVEKAA